MTNEQAVVEVMRVMDRYPKPTFGIGQILHQTRGLSYLAVLRALQSLVREGRLLIADETSGDSLWLSLLRRPTPLEILAGAVVR